MQRRTFLEKCFKSIQMIRREVIKNHLSDARKNASYQVVVGQFSFESDWLRKWREFSESIAQRGNPKPKQSQMIFHSENSRHFLDQSDLKLKLANCLSSFHWIFEMNTLRANWRLL